MTKGDFEGVGEHRALGSGFVHPGITRASVILLGKGSFCSSDKSNREDLTVGWP